MLKTDDILSLREKIDFPTMVLLFLLDVDGPLFIVLIGIYVISVSQNEVGVSLFHWVWSETAVHFSPVLNTLRGIRLWTVTELDNTRTSRARHGGAAGLPE